MQNKNDNSEAYPLIIRPGRLTPWSLIRHESDDKDNYTQKFGVSSTVPKQHTLSMETPLRFQYDVMRWRQLYMYLVWPGLNVKAANRKQVHPTSSRPYLELLAAVWFVHV